MADFRSLMPFGRGVPARGGYDPFTSLRQEMDKLLEDFGSGWPALGEEGRKGFLVPKVDIAETPSGLELTADLPGFDEKDLNLDIHDGVLTINATHEEENEAKDEKKHYHLVERRQGSFLRRIQLPFEADAAKAEANLEKGVLKVTVPRLATEERKPTQIPIGGKKG